MFALEKKWHKPGWTILIYFEFGRLNWFGIFKLIFVAILPQKLLSKSEEGFQAFWEKNDYFHGFKL